MKLYRQGDVLFLSVPRLPKLAKKRDPHALKAGVLVEGEATGHHHSVECLEDAEVFDCGGDLYIRVTGDRVGLAPSVLDGKIVFEETRGAAIVHQDHGYQRQDSRALVTNVLPRGIHRVVRQREYAPEAIRHVQD